MIKLNLNQQSLKECFRVKESHKKKHLVKRQKAKPMGTAKTKKARKKALKKDSKEI